MRILSLFFLISCASGGHFIVKDFVAHAYAGKTRGRACDPEGC